MKTHKFQTTENIVLHIEQIFKDKFNINKVIEDSLSQQMQYSPDLEFSENISKTIDLIYKKFNDSELIIRKIKKRNNRECKPMIKSL